MNSLYMRAAYKYPLQKEYYHHLVKYKLIEQTHTSNSFLGSANDQHEVYVRKRYKNYLIFEKNYYAIEGFNNKSNSAKLALNHFADQIDFDSDHHVDINPNMLDEMQYTNFDIAAKQKIFKYPLEFINNYLKIPSYRNWDTYLSPTKNQGACGSCWAFSSTSAIESLMRICNYSSVRLSEQELIDYSTENSGCEGGLMHLAFDYCIENNGLVAESNYSYLARANNQSDVAFDKIPKVPGSNISDYEFIIPRSTLDIMSSLRHGPIAIAIDASSLFFRFYSSGIIDFSTNSSESVNHAVLLTGYNLEPNNSYWIIQNSWGDDWGENGFAKLKMQEGSGILNCQLYGVYPMY